MSVAHRLSTAERADLVLVFDQGRIVERGPHDELVAAGGRYAALYESWLGNTRTGPLARGRRPTPTEGPGRDVGVALPRFPSPEGP